MVLAVVLLLAAALGAGCLPDRMCESLTQAACAASYGDWGGANKLRERLIERLESVGQGEIALKF